MSKKKQEGANSDSDSSYDESLDLTSPMLDPLKALYSSRVKVPIPNAVTLDNLAQYAQYAKKFQQNSGVESMSLNSNLPATSKQKASSSNAAASYQRFQPHQQMIPARKRPPKKNILSRMPSAAGPLARLWEAVDGKPRGRVRVVTRDEHGVHGRLEGYVVLFDKHWNLAMSDVTEVFYRAAPRRAKDFFHDEPQQVAELSDRLADLGVSHRLPGSAGSAGRGAGTAGLPDPLDLVPRAELAQGLAGGHGKGRGKRTRAELDDWPPLPKVFYRAHGKRQECVRHVGQLLVRGEHIVYVQFLTPAQFEAERQDPS